jgi:hypothetical protein
MGGVGLRGCRWLGCGGECESHSFSSKGCKTSKWSTPSSQTNKYHLEYIYSSMVFFPHLNICNGLWS